jgi:hypothetical protein
MRARDAAVRDVFGLSVAVSGPTLVVGAAGDDVGSNADQGSAYVFVGRRGQAATGSSDGADQVSSVSIR